MVDGPETDAHRFDGAVEYKAQTGELKAEVTSGAEKFVKLVVWVERQSGIRTCGTEQARAGGWVTGGEGCVKEVNALARENSGMSIGEGFGR